MVEQRIYIPYATDNWLVWVRLPPGVPNFYDKYKMQTLCKERILPFYELKQTYIDKIYQIDLSAEIDATTIVNSVYKFKEQYPMSNTSNILSWHSDYNTHEKTRDFDTLINVIENKLTLIEKTRPGFVNKFLDCWVAIYNKTESAQWHNHCQDFDNTFGWAVVYYAKAEKNAAPILFKNLEIVPKTNMLLVFPSRAYHMVRPSVSNLERIVFAGNLNAVNI